MLRDIEREKAFRPLARVVNLEENEKAAKMKVKRMIHHLKDDPENHLHSQIIVDFVAERNAACVWYVLSTLVAVKPIRQDEEGVHARSRSIISPTRCRMRWT